MKRLALTITAACAAIITAAVLAASGGAQQPGPPTGTLELVSRDRESHFAYIDNPPRRRESAGDLFVINGRLRDASNRPAGRVHAAIAVTQSRPVVSQGTATFTLGNGQIVAAGVFEDDRTDTLAVVGGSGAYTAARGTLVATETRTTTRFVFTFAG